jgi:hypothetical protein
MGHPPRKFTEEEDALIRVYAETGVGLKPLARDLHTGQETVRRRANELTGVPNQVESRDKANDIVTRPITVGDDDLLKRLRAVHAERITK